MAPRSPPKTWCSIERVLVKVTSPDTGDAIWEGGDLEKAAEAEPEAPEAEKKPEPERRCEAVCTTGVVVDRHRFDGHLRGRRRRFGGPGAGAHLRLQRLRSQQRLGHVQPLELRQEFRRRVAHRRIGGDPQLFFAVADLGRGSAAVSGERERVDQLAVGRVDEDLVADGDRAIHAAGFPRAGERELLDARLEDGHEAGLEPRGVDAVEQLRLA